MSVTIDLKLLLIALVLIALIILIIYAIVAVRKLLITLDRTNKILEDAEVVSGIAAERSKDINAIVTDISCSVSEISGALKDSRGTLAAVIALIKSVASLKGALSRDKDTE